MPGAKIRAGDRLPLKWRNGEIEIAVDVGVEVESAALHQLHHGGPGHQLGDGPGAEQRSFRVDWPAGRNIGNTITLGREDAAIGDH